MSRCIPSNLDGGVAECSGQKQGPASWLELPGRGDKPSTLCACVAKLVNAAALEAASGQDCGFESRRRHSYITWQLGLCTRAACHQRPALTIFRLRLS